MLVNYEKGIFSLEDNGQSYPFENEEELMKILQINDSERWRFSKDYLFLIYQNGIIVVKEGAIERFRKDFPYFINEEKLKELAYLYRYTNQYYHSGRTYFDYDKAIYLYMLLYFNNPQIELLSKIKGFENFIFQWSKDQSNPKFKRAFKRGKNINEITNMPKWFWHRLIDEGVNIEKWNTLRIWNNQIKKELEKDLKESNEKRKQNGLKPIIAEGLTKESLDIIFDLNLDNVTLEKVRKIIRNTVDVDGNRMFTVEKLVKFLERVDMYQAIRTNEAIDILTDYIRMCKHLGVEPRLDSDSLKREHDVTARNYSLWQREKQVSFEKEKVSLFKERGKVLSKYEFTDDRLTVLSPKVIKDLINEGYHNHNCVGSYVDAFAKGKSNIFFIRKASDLTKSYITIELNKNCTDYRQAFYAGNQRITKKDDLSFIKKWLENNKKINGLVV